MSTYTAGDLVKVLHSDWPELIPVGSTKKVVKVHSGGVYLESEELGQLLFYVSEVEPAWNVADVKVGDKVKVTRVEEGVVEYVYGSGDIFMNGIMIGADNPSTTFELIEVAKPAPKVGDGFTPGLPVGTVMDAVNSTGHPEFRTADGWVSAVGGVASDDTDWNPDVWKIVYLPEA